MSYEHKVLILKMCVVAMIMCVVAMMGGSAMAAMLKGDKSTLFENRNLASVLFVCVPCERVCVDTLVDMQVVRGADPFPN